MGAVVLQIKSAEIFCTDSTRISQKNSLELSELIHTDSLLSIGWILVVYICIWLYGFYMDCIATTFGLLGESRLETGGNPKQMAWHHPVHDAGAHQMCEV